MRIRTTIVYALISIVSSVTAIAQESPQLPLLPVDSAVRIGHLPNGLTYYIRHNEYPADVANFYIAQRVGSINEDDDQRGLAHFLEHMAFNGSEHFEGNGIIDYTRSLGVKFGRNLNAYTSIDETVYHINDVPVARNESAVDSCLLILKDWSNGLLLDSCEIDKERGVIHEEWRLRSSAMQRMLERSLPALYPGSKYGQRMPIGLMEIIDNFPPQALRDYYHKWYRPDNQAIVVVGDIDVDHVEAKIHELFGAITVDADAARVVAEPVPDNFNAIYVSEKDPEMPFTQMALMVKTPPMADSLKPTVAYLIDSYAKTMAGTMLCSRLNEMAQDSVCPFLEAVAGYGNYIMSKTMLAFSFTAIPKEGREMETLQAMYTELRRTREFGFTATEYERARADYMSALEKAYSNRNKTRNDNYARQYYRHYLDKEPIPAIEDEYQLMAKLTPAIDVSYINEYVKGTVTETDTNLVVLYLAQEKDEGGAYATADDMRSAVEKARSATVEAYVDNVKSGPLVAQLPEKGSIVSESVDTVLGFKDLILSNGARVIMKKTDFKDDEVIFSATAKGGYGQYGENDYSNLKLIDAAVESSGLGGFSSTELEKALAGKIAGVGAKFRNTITKLSGSCTPWDMETLMQLVYLYYTDITPDEASYSTVMNTFRTVIRNKGLKPESAFADSLTATLYCHNPRLMPVVEADIDNADYQRMLQIARQLLRSPSSYTFTVVGNFDEDTLRNLLCTYIASLPALPDTVSAVDVATHAQGEVVNSFTRDMETPKVIEQDVWFSDAPYTLANAVLADIAGQVLTMFYLKTIREDAGAAYTVSASGYATRVLDRQQVKLQVRCPMDPAKADAAMALLHKGLAEARLSTDPDMLQKVKEYLFKQADVDARNNNYWVGIIDDYLMYGVDMHTDYKQMVERTTPADVTNFVNDVLLKDGNHVSIIMKPTADGAQ